MKLFVGARTPCGGTRVFVVDYDGVREIEEARDLYDYGEPLDWGNMGRGAYQLALALLFETTESRITSLALHPSFCDSFVAKLDADMWGFTPSMIFEWIIGRVEEAIVRLDPCRQNGEAGHDG